jgi:hypothetical protein
VSGYTQTTNEVTYSYANPSTNLATFTAEDNLLKTFPPVFIPAGFYFNAGDTGKSLRIKAAGQIGFTTGSPTFTWSMRLIAATSPPAWSAGGVLLGSTAAAAMGASAVVTTWWYLDADIILRTLATGAASTVVTTGEVRCPAGMASPFAATIPSLGTSPAVATVDNSQSYYLYLSAACSASNSLNLINTQLLKVYGEN